MVQQAINLCEHLDRHEELPVGARHIGVASVAMLALMVLVALYQWADTRLDASRIADATAHKQQLSAELTALQATLGDGAGQRGELDVLRLQLQQKRQVLASLASQDDQSSTGFSEHLGGLGRQYQEGLWLQHIALRAGGEQIGLKGSMQKASLLPRYLQQLGSEDVFSGLRFQLMRIEEIENAATMRFEVTVIPEQDNAGGEA